MSRVISLLFFLFIFFSQLANADPTNQIDSTENFIRGDEESIATIHNCVNVVTGVFFQVDTDLFIDGPEPLSFTRTYDSSHLLNYSYGMGFTSKYPLRIRDLQKGKKHYHASIETQEGAHLEFRERRRVGNTIHLSLEPKVFEMGLSNYSESGISAHTNAGNLDATFYDFDKKKENGKWIVRCPDGSRRHYFNTQSIEVEEPWRLSGENAALLTHIDLPTGNQSHFKYLPVWHNNILMPFESMYQTNAAGKKLGAISYRLTKGNSYQIIGSNGQSITYKVEKEKHKFDMKGRTKPVEIDVPILKEVSAPHLPTTRYKSDKFGKKKKQQSCKVYEIAKPDGRILNISYDSEGKVSKLKAPIGSTSRLLLLYTFDYKKNVTTVTNALGQKTQYHITKNKRIASIENYVGNNLYCSKDFFWDEKNGWIRCKAYGVGGRRVNKAISYRYDWKGNVLEEIFFGNLTGNASDLFSFDGGRISGSPESCSTYSTYSDDAFNLKLSESDDFGLQALYSYKSGTNLLTKKLVLHHGNIQGRTFYTYDNNAVLIKTIEDNGSSKGPNNLTGVTERLITTITPVSDHLPSLGKPAEIKESYYDPNTQQEHLLRCTKCTYSPHGFLKRKDVFDANMTFAYSECIVYDRRDLVVKTTDALGQETHYDYGANHNKIYEEEIGSGKHTHHSYDRMNRLIQVKEEHDNGDIFVTKHQYDVLGNRIATIDPYGNKTTYIYDTLSRLIETRYPLMKNAVGETVKPKKRKEYDRNHRVIRETDERGFSMTTTYTAYDKPITITNPDETTEKFEYFHNGWLKNKWSQDGVCTEYAYDPNGRVIRETLYDKEGNFVEQTTKKYRGRRLIEEVDFSENLTEYQYDAAGRKIAEILHSAEGERKTTYSYDSLSRLNKTIHWLEGGIQRIEHKEYDLLDRVVEERVADQDGCLFRKVTHAYDRNGNKTTKETHLSDKKTIAERTEYDSHNLPILQVDPLGHQTTIAYDYWHKNSLGQNVLKITTTDPMGGLQIEVFDAYNRLVSFQKQTANGQILSHQEIHYDATGNKRKQIEHVYENGSSSRDYVITWTYDSMGRVSTLIEQDEERKITRYTYDKAGRKQTIEKPDGVVLTHTYHPTGLLKTITSSDGSISYAYQYDSNHNPIEMIDDLTDETTSRKYNAFNERAEETQANGLSTFYQHDPLGRVTKVALPNGESIDYIYDAKNLVEARYKDYQEAYKKFDYRGLPCERCINDGQASIQVEWDEIGRKVTTDSTFWYEHLDIFDAKGNLLHLNYRDSQGPVSESYNYDPLDQLIKEEGASNHTYSHDSIYNRLKKDEHLYAVNDLNQYESDGQAQYTFDPNGNLIEKVDRGSTQHFTYDALNRLTSVTIPDGIINYRYDAEGRRLTKETIKNGNSTTTKFLYQFDTEIGAVNEDDELFQLRILRNGKGEGSMLAVKLDQNFYTAISDHRGNIRCLVDVGRGDVAQNYRYSAFGEKQLIDDSGALGSPWGFANKRRDEDTGHVHFLKRDYLPDLGRWLTTDPLDFADGPNLYAYVRNNPLIFQDAYGLFVQPIVTGSYFFNRNPLFSDSKNQGFMYGAQRGFIDDSTWGLSSYALGEYHYPNLSSQLGYYAGTSASLATGFAYGGTEVKMARGLGILASKATRPIFQTMQLGKGFNTVGRIAKLGRESKAMREIAEAVKKFSPVSKGKMGLNKVQAITPKNYFGSKTYSEMEILLTGKFGPPRGVGQYNKSFYNFRTGRTYNLHLDPLHRGGKPHLDIRKRGLGTDHYKDKPFFLREK